MEHFFLLDVKKFLSRLDIFSDIRKNVVQIKIFTKIANEII